MEKNVAYILPETDKKNESGAIFRTEFISFLMGNGIPFECAGNRIFLFKGQKAAVVLVFFADFNNVCTAGPFLNFCRRMAAYANSSSCDDILYLYEDRWLYSKKFMQEHILARLGRFTSVFARKCKVITNSSVKNNTALSGMIAKFLEDNHSYGNAKCKYRYALDYCGKIVAVATFSHPRRIPRNINGEMVTFSSYEWVRYASAPNCRVIGGMGRLLRAFIAEMQSAEPALPIEIMSYSDNEWSAGNVYGSLGFTLLQEREPVWFYVNEETFMRISFNKATRQGIAPAAGICNNSSIKIHNLGSRKFICHPLMPLL